MNKEKKILKIMDKVIKSSGNSKHIEQANNFLTLYAIDNHLFDIILSSGKNPKEIDLFIQAFITLYNHNIIITSGPVNYYKEGEDTFLQKVIKNATKIEDFEYLFPLIKHICFFDSPSLNSFFAHKGEDNKTVFENIYDNFFLRNDDKKILEVIANYSIDSIIDSYDEIYNMCNTKHSFEFIHAVKEVLFESEELRKYLSRHEDKIKEVIEKLFYDIDYTLDDKNLLWIVKDGESVYIDLFEMLLELGVDPNFIGKDRMDFIVSWISCGMSDEDIIRLLQLAINHGYDVNKKINVINNFSCIRNYNVYKFMCDNGFNTFTYGVDKEKFLKIEKGAYYFNKKYLSKNDKKFLKLYDINYITDGLNYMLEKHCISLSDTFRKDLELLYDEFIEFKDRTKIFIGVNNEAHFIRLLADEIVKLYSNSINDITNDSDSKISMNIVLDALKMMIINNEIVLTDKIEKCKEKQLKLYKKQVND